MKKKTMKKLNGLWERKKEPKRMDNKNGKTSNWKNHKLHKWKSLGLEKLPNFWLNILTSTHKVLTHTLSQTMKNLEQTPEWLEKGITYLLPKMSETNNLKNYRPTTWPSTRYKLLASIITELLKRTEQRKKQNAAMRTEKTMKWIIRM